jgi:hypothetical protein
MMKADKAANETAIAEDEAIKIRRKQATKTR